ncbi:putative oxidoreductase [Chitinophaga skermanii]|uniref:Putative oxidoreductase n=1 Tax=Chitinophaga skermanii TaxID=331697 RepID=A0A327QCG2_9BACT|nr:DoxX family protein [Chitinophaga skermanii]RAJ01665.1 putative oxidoreductase [Chitinophaga skermanii]
MKPATPLARFLVWLQDWPLLFMRLVLAYGFFTPAKTKWSDISSIGAWFQQLGIPLPMLNAYLAAGTEALGVVLLTLGLATRIISIPLMVVMCVAIRTVHWSNGFDAGNNGFEIPLYYLIMLFTLLVYGPGKMSVDHLIQRNKQSR